MIDFNGKMYNMNGIYRVFIDGELVAEQKNKLTLLGRSNALKTMLGLVPSFAGSMGIGISSKANTSSGAYLDMADLDFSVGRYPITAASLGQNDAEDVLVYTARITDPSRYYITELGLYSNKLSSNFEADNRVIFNFESGDPLKLSNNSYVVTTGTYAVTAVTPSSPAVGSATYTATGHTFNVGDSVTISGSNIAGYNGTFTITAIATNIFTVANATTGAATFTDGTVINSKPHFISDFSNYRIGSNALKLTQTDTITFNDSVLDMGYVAPYDSFVLAGNFSGSYTVRVTFLSASGNAVYDFASGGAGYKVLLKEKNEGSNYAAVDWSKITSVTIANVTTGTTILDGLRVKKYKTVDSVEGLVSRAVLSAPIEKPLGSVVDIQYLLEMGMVI